MIPDFPKNSQWFNTLPLSFTKELKGKIVVLDFWTYCCINCMHVLPELAALERKYADDPVVFVGVHSAKFTNEKNSENIRQAVLRYEIAHPVINDVDMAMWRQLGVRSWPTVVVVGPEGQILQAVSGEGQGSVIDGAIQEGLKKYKDALDKTPIPMQLEKEKENSTSPLKFPAKLATDIEGKKLFVSDSNNHRILICSFDGDILDIIGNGYAGLNDGT
jgi:thiol-disulfide isomerase/thioredoxin